MLDAFTPALPHAAPSDTALLLVTVARLQHVSSYAWLQGLLDHVQEHMLAFDGQVCVALFFIVLHRLNPIGLETGRSALPRKVQRFADQSAPCGV